jgi:hypothetical protein
VTDAVPSASLLDWIIGLVTDPAARARFAVDPGGALGEQGLADLDPVDLQHALPLVTDTVAARIDATVTSSVPPALLQGETPVEALVRQFTVVSDTVVPGEDGHLLPDLGVRNGQGPDDRHAYDFATHDGDVHDTHHLDVAP